uniref:ATP synthase complex subunit 8 n=1 Tax=Neosynchiropus moyeri TaxID=1147744 RepID=A0A060NZ37_9TELE|nr:ATP synthase F0 subunit 8 [Neosynchiropus moyeri]BAO84788.1 ATPase subunit 8 [Neosynchiropus moyeri]
MPQLNTFPWLLILLFSWLVFLTLLPTKVLSHIYPNKLTLEAKEASSKNSWTWPW